MSESTRRAAQRRLRKAVGDDAMTLMAAMSGILQESVFPLLQQHGEQLRELTAKIETLEGMVKQLVKRGSPQLAVMQGPFDQIDRHPDPSIMTDQRVGAEVV